MPPEKNENAVKGCRLFLLDSIPGLAGKFKAPDTNPREFEAVVKSAEQATILALVVH
jgi:hypothetical protein